MRAAVRSLAELGASEQVWIARAVPHTVGHRDGRSGTAFCGAYVEKVPSTAGHLRTLSGSLCPTCWGSNRPRWPRPRRDARNRRAEQAGRLREMVNRARLADRTPQTRDLFEEYRQLQQGSRWTR